MREWIIGRNPIYEVLKASRRHAFQIQIAEKVQKKDRLAEVLRMSAEKKIPVKQVPRHDLDLSLIHI